MDHLILYTVMMLSIPEELSYQLVVERFVFELKEEKNEIMVIYATATVCSMKMKVIIIVIPITPKYASPVTVPASFARIQLYKPASLSRTFEINKSPVSKICIRFDSSTGVESTKKKQNKIIN